MPGFFDRLRDFFSGRGYQPPPPEPKQEFEPTPEAQEHIQEEREEHVYFEPGREIPYKTKTGKDAYYKVLPRWSIGSKECDIEIDIDDLRDLFSIVGSMPTYTIIVTGKPCNPYPGKEDEEIITLGYAIDGQSTLYHLDVSDSVEDFATTINNMSENAYLECWETVCELSLVLYTGGILG